jgi:hypothetical protein
VKCVITFKQNQGRCRAEIFQGFVELSLAEAAFLWSLVASGLAGTASNILGLPPLEKSASIVD